MSYTITFTRPALLHAAMLCRSTDATRYYLHGAQVERAPEGGVFIVGTDGHRLSLGIDREATVEGDFPEGGVILPIPKDCLAKLKEGTRAAPETVIYDRAAGRFAIDGQSWAVEPIDGTFPDWRRVLPPREGLVPLPPVRFNAACLATFDKIGKALGRRTVALRLAATAASAPHWVDIGEPDWRGVLMPYRWKTDAPVYADFV